MLNRVAVIVKRKKPFFDWLKALPDPCDVTPEEADDDSTVYLFPEYEDDSEFVDENGVVIKEANAN